MTKYIATTFASVALAVFLILPGSITFAQPQDIPPPQPPGDSSSDIKLQNPLGENMTNPSVIAGNIIKVVLGLVGSISLVIFIYGGLLWMTSSGNKEQVTKGRNTLIWATLGLLVIFSSYTIINFVLRKLAGQS